MPRALQSVGGFEAQEAAADYDGVPKTRCGVDHRFGVGDIAVSDDAGEICARKGKHHRIRPSREQQSIVGHSGAIGRFDDAARAIDSRDLRPGAKVDVVLRVPLALVQHDLGERLLARENRRKQDAVVVGMRLRTEDRDVVEIRRDLQQLFDGTHAGHAVADDDKFRALDQDARVHASSTCAWRRYRNSSTAVR